MKKNRLPKSAASSEANQQQEQRQQAFNFVDGSLSAPAAVDSFAADFVRSGSTVETSPAEQVEEAEDTTALSSAVEMSVLSEKNTLWQTASDYLAMDEEVESLYPDFPVSTAEAAPEKPVSDLQTEVFVAQSAALVTAEEAAHFAAKKAHRLRFWPFTRKELELSPVQLEIRSRKQALAKEQNKTGRRVRLSFVLRRFWSKSLHKVSHRRILILSVTVFTLASFILLPHFYVNHVTVTGLKTLSAETLLAASGLEPGQHMIKGLGGTLESYLRLRYHHAEEKLKEKFPYIEEVAIRPDFPYGLTVAVQERVGVAYIQQEQMVVIVDREGVVLHIQDHPAEGLPLIEGIHDSFVEVGKPMNQSLKQAITSTVLILSTIIDTDRLADDNWKFFERVESILPVHIDSHFLKVKLPGDRFLTVKLGSVSEMKDNLYWLRSILKIGELDQLPEGLLDISGKQRIFIPARHFKTHIIEGNVVNAGLFDRAEENASEESDANDNPLSAETGSGPHSDQPQRQPARQEPSQSRPTNSDTESVPAASFGPKKNSDSGDRRSREKAESARRPNIEIDLPDFDHPKPFTNQTADSVQP